MDEQELIEFWKRLHTNDEPFIHENDKGRISHIHSITCRSYQEFFERKSNNDNEKKKIHVNLLPIPYIGDLKKGNVFLLLANPGVGPTDYKAEIEDSDYRKSIIENLFQEPNREYPFYPLNPKFSWTDGFQYWIKKFSPLIDYLVQKNNSTYIDTLQYISKKIVVLELLPYHSEKHVDFPGLPSSEKIKKFVKDVLVPKAKKEEISIIVMRCVRSWGIDAEYSESIINYASQEARSASLHNGSNGFNGIMKRL